MSSLDSILKKHIEGAANEGMILGYQMAIDCLSSAKAQTAPENQTWETAIAFLSLAKADVEAVIND